MGQSRLQRGTLQWTGEHWVAMLRPAVSDRDSAIVSLFALRYSPAGEGHVAVVRIDQGVNRFESLCTDNENLLPFAVPRLFERAAYWKLDLPVTRCRFARTGDATRDPGWRIEPAAGDEVEVRWIVEEPPITVNTPWRNDQDVFSILSFTEEAQVHLGGRRVEGRPYLRDIWRDSIGGERSSCCFALAESFFDVPASEAKA